MLFYVLKRDDKNKWIDYDKSTDWESIKCPKYDGHQRAGKRIGQLKVNINSTKALDFYWTFLGECVINDKVANILHDNKITGFELQEVGICNSYLPYKLWELCVTGNGGDAHEYSGIFLKSKCEFCGYETYSSYENGIIVDENNWDKSDIFTITGYSRRILVTEKVKKLIEKNNLTGVTIMPSHELKWLEGVIKN